MYIDTHIHLTDERYTDLQELLLAAKTNNVNKVISLSTDIQDAIATAKIAEQHEMVYYGVGIHPHQAKDAKENDINEAEDLIRASSSKLVVVGEIGLDYFYGLSEKETQKVVFRQMLRLAAKYRKVVCLHTRNAERDVLEITKEFALDKILCHSYTGDLSVLEGFLERGAYISINGMITFGKAENLVAIAKQIPLDRLLVETDGPYLTPAPFRGQVNRPEYIPIIVKKLSEVLAIEQKELAETIRENSRRFFNV